jgi:hypothetical protein
LALLWRKRAADTPSPRFSFSSSSNRPFCKGRSGPALVLLALGGLAAGCGGGETGAKAPTLGVVWSPGGQKGYGRVEPKTVFNGGEPTGRVDHVRWRGWGTFRAVGMGRGWFPRGNHRPGFRRVTVKLVASGLGTCRGRPAYTGIEFAFLVSGRYEGGAHYNICTGDSMRESAPLSL